MDISKMVADALRRESRKWSHMAKRGGNSDIAAALWGVADELDAAARGMKIDPFTDELVARPPTQHGGAEGAD